MFYSGKPRTVPLNFIPGGQLFPGGWFRRKGFNIIAVEGDWPSAYQLNQYIKGNSSAGSATEALKKF